MKVETFRWNASTRIHLPFYQLLVLSNNKNISIGESKTGRKLGNLDLCAGISCTISIKQQTTSSLIVDKAIAT
ncbi:MAG TPA: hypothetical protein DD379_17830, partial [Cyanobacteria bacterium UBA11162]|nr:hypothetical protein [Cyanobacteria bacterium UBA11162]